MNKKMAMIAMGIALIFVAAWYVVQNKHQNEFEKQSPVIQAVSEIEKNLNESDHKRK